MIIATGFMLRLLAGTWGVGIAPSAWLLLCGGLMTLFLGFVLWPVVLIWAYVDVPSPRRNEARQ